MALTGKGIETNPYIIRSYDDLKESQTATPESGDILYLKLGSNINCKDYGDQFLWYTIKYDNYITIIDMNNHCIKNPLIAQDNSLFEFNVEPTTHYSRMYNGDILNVYCRNAKNIFYTTKTCVSVHFSKVRFSINLNTITQGVFRYAVFDTCSFYIACDDILFGNDTNTTHTMFFLYNDSIVTSEIEPKIDACMSKCDFLFDMKPKTMGGSNKYCLINSHQTEDPDGTALRNCRIQGTITNYFLFASNGYAAGWNSPSKSHYIDSNVFNLIVDGQLESFTRAYVYNSQPHYSSICCIKGLSGNTLTMSSNDSRLYNVNAEQLKDAEYLKERYFPVEKI